MLQNIFDTHAHYDDEAFDQDRDRLLSTVLPEGGVSLVLTQGTDLVTSVHSLELAKKYDYIYAAMGYHPEQAGDERKGDLDVLAEIISSEDKAVAIGEIGLDYHWEENPPKETQLDLFERQLALAKDLDLPVVVHDRDAHQDTMELLKKYRPKGVMHCFSGATEMMQDVVSLGMYVGLGGAVTFKNAKKPVAVATEVPLDRLLLETDCPYMAPTPYRGQRNQSTFIAEVATLIASLKGEDPQHLVDVCNENGRTLFGIN